jgi:hypothetical protein
MTNLFQHCPRNPFKRASGSMSDWKIECEALTANDWEALAVMAVALLPPFGRVAGVPRGGVPFADALRRYTDPNSWSVVLIAEDVVTTGASMERVRNGSDAIPRVFPHQPPTVRASNRVRP